MKKDDIMGGVMLIIVVAIAGAFFLFAPEAPEISYGPVDLPGSAMAATALGNGEVEVVATLVKPGYVTIHQSIGGAPGPMIGLSGYLNAGEDIATTIVLSELLQPGLPFVALLHVDNGDAEFVTTDDMPVTSGGVSVRSDFVWTDKEETE
jgi:hypothetical protein